MLVKCSFCGKQKIVENEVYSSPLFHCEMCGKLFYDSKVKEPGLNPPPINKREKIDFLTYVGIPAGLFLLIFGLLGVISDGLEYVWILILGLLMLVCSCFFIFSSYRDKNKRNEHYQKCLNESHQRLSKLSYQEQLVIASNGSDDIVSLLTKYNASHNLDYILDINSILQNYELKNIAKHTDYKQEENAIDFDEAIAMNEEIKEANNLKLFCRKCGTYLLLDSNFCHRCGERVKTK